MPKESTPRFSVARTTIILLALLALAVIGGAVAWRRWSTSAAPTYVARDSALRSAPLFFYPAASDTPRGFLFFLGNDVAFWEPHQQLARRLSRAGYAVVGLDLRKWLDGLPDESVAVRESAVAAGIGPLIARARHELHADSLDAVVGGHSFGAEVALWIAMHRPPPKLAGVLAMSPRGSGHFFVTAADWTNEEASGPGSFSTVELMRDIPASVRIAVIRGAKDDFSRWDSTFAAVAGERYKHYTIPTVGHSIRNLVMAGPFIEWAMAFLTDARR